MKPSFVRVYSGIGYPVDYDRERRRQEKQMYEYQCILVPPAKMNLEILETIMRGIRTPPCEEIIPLGDRKTVQAYRKAEDEYMKILKKKARYGRSQKTRNVRAKG